MRRIYKTLLVVMLGLGVFASLSASIYFPIVYRAPATPTPTPTQTPIYGPILLPNGDFEQGAVIWTESSNHNFDIIVHTGELPVIPHKGQWAAWLGGANDAVDKINQKVLVPADHPYLYFWLWIQSTDECDNDFANIYVANVLIDRHDLCYDHRTNGWEQKVYNLAAYAGQTVDLLLSVETNATEASSIYLDDFEFQVDLPR